MAKSKTQVLPESEPAPPQLAPDGGTYERDPETGAVTRLPDPADEAGKPTQTQNAED